MTDTTSPTDTTGHANLATGLAAFQAEMPTVPKSKTATIPGKEGRAGYSYAYADLAAVTSAAMPLLARHGLSFVCLPQSTGNAYVLVGRLLHVSGESVEGSLPLFGREAQALGSSLTYARRYLLGCLTGVVTDDDDDGDRAHRAAERTQVDRRPAAQRLWEQARTAATIDAVKAAWSDAAAQGLLGVPIHHEDGEEETLEAALRTHGNMIVAQETPPSEGESPAAPGTDQPAAAQPGPADAGFDQAALRGVVEVAFNTHAGTPEQRQNRVRALWETLSNRHGRAALQAIEVNLPDGRVLSGESFIVDAAKRAVEDRPLYDVAAQQEPPPPVQ